MGDEGTPERQVAPLHEGELAWLRATLEHMDAGVSVFDRNLCLVGWNARLLEMLDLPPEMARVGAPFAELIRYNAERGEYGPGDPEQHIAERVALARRFEPHIFERQRPDGTMLEVRGNPLPGGGFVTVYTDITARKRAEEALKLANEEAERRLVLSRLTRLISSSLDLDEVLREIARAAAELTATPGVAIWTADEVTQTLELRAFSDECLGADYPGRTLRFGWGGAGWVAVHRKPLMVADALTDERVVARDWFKAHGLRSAYVLPVVHQTSLLGVLALLGVRPFPFEPADHELLEGFVAQAAGAIRNARLYTEATRRQREAEELARVARRLTESLDVTAVGERIVESVLPLFGAHGSAVRLLQPAGSLVGIAWAGEAREHFKPGHTVRSGMGVSGRAVLEGRPVSTRDVLSDPNIALTDDLRSRNVSGGFHGSLAVPLRVRGQVIGAVYIADQRVRAFSEDEVALLQAFADQAALALENARLYQEAEGRRRQAEVVAALAQDINASLDLDTVLRHVAEGARELCRSDLAHIALRDSASETLKIEFRYWAGHRRLGPQVFRVEPGKGVGGQVLLTGRPFRTDDYGSDPRITKDYLPAIEAEGIVASMAVPIRLEGRVEGVLFVDSRTHAFTETDEAILLQLADHAGIAIGNAQLFAREQGARARAEVSEVRFRDLVEGLDAIVWEADATTWQFSFVSQRAREILGYPVDRWLGSSEFWVTHLHPDDRERAVALCLRGMAERDAYELEFRMLAADGRVVWFRDIVGVVRDAEGQARQLRGVMIDITERKRLEGNLRQAQKMEAVGRLAGGVAHDFNNLLAVILGHSELMLAALPGTDPLRRDAEEIRKASDRAAALTRQLLAFSRRQVLQPQVLDFNAVATNMASMLRRLIGEDIELVTRLDPGLGRVKADPGQIEQVVMNLAVNARDAMPQGGRLALETTNIELDEAFVSRHPGAGRGRYVRLSVTDNGVGMDPDTRAQVFEPFFTTKGPGQGTGLGLSTAYGIVKQHHGYIAVESEPGRGSRFEIYLPRVEEPLEGVEEGVIRGAPPRGSETILLVEDEEALRDLVQEILSRSGYSVLEAASGPEGVETARRHATPIHLLVTDVVMPQMGGRKLAELLRSLRRDIRVLYISGYAADALGPDGVLDPGTSFLQKPFTPEALLRKVREVLEAATRG